jgi:predicted nucleotidyltransferase
MQWHTQGDTERPSRWFQAPGRRPAPGVFTGPAATICCRSRAPKIADEARRHRRPLSALSILWVGAPAAVVPKKKPRRTQAGGARRHRTAAGWRRGRARRVKFPKRSRHPGREGGSRRPGGSSRERRAINRSVTPIRRPAARAGSNRLSGKGSGPSALSCGVLTSGLTVASPCRKRPVLRYDADRHDPRRYSTLRLCCLGARRVGISETWLGEIRQWAARTDSVREVWLFAARAKGDSQPESDVDLAIVLMPPSRGTNWALANYFEFGDDWQRELSAALGRHVSLEALLPGSSQDRIVRSTGVRVWTRSLMQPPAGFEMIEGPE